MARAEAERDATRNGAGMAWLETDAEGNALAQMLSELARVQHALTASKGVQLKAESELDFVRQALASAGEACRNAEKENCHLIDERLSLIMELGVSKEELLAFQAKVTKKMKAMEKEFDASCDVIFNYGYDCCAFAHNIYESDPMIPVGMPDTIKPLPP